MVSTYGFSQQTETADQKQAPVAKTLYRAYHRPYQTDEQLFHDRGKQLPLTENEARIHENN
jgi:hypothetical protein